MIATVRPYSKFRIRGGCGETVIACAGRFILVNGEVIVNLDSDDLFCSRDAIFDNGLVFEEADATEPAV